jgi:multiphosphoryl transfer protein
MVSLVLVSHSRPLALALKDLVQQVAGGNVAIQVAAGVGPEREEFGTDAVEIMEAIQSVYSEAGVLVLMDLGSAVISAEMALEFLPPEMQEKVVFCAAPLVEGAIAAAVQAGLGSPLREVCAEARQALVPKQEQLGEPPQAAGAESPAGSPPPKEAQSIVLRLGNPHGLHARPAARFVQTAAGYQADIRVSNRSNQKGPVPARSLNALATLAAMKDHEIEISASGPQAGEALAALEALVRDNFGEVPELDAPPEAPASAKAADIVIDSGEAQQAIPISEGVALAPVYVLKESAPAIPTHSSTDPEQDWRKLQAAVDKARHAIQRQYQDMAAAIGEAKAAIFQAHLLILDDPLMQVSARQGIFSGQKNAARAWKEATDEAAENYRQLDDPYLQQRAQDVQDVSTQVLRALLGGQPAEATHLPEPVIIYAEDLTPSQTAGLDLDKVLGLVTAGGGPTSHSAILARAMAVPAVAGARLEVDRLPPGTRMGVDGSSGRIWINPDPAQSQELEARREEWLSYRRRLLEDKLLPAATRDGHSIEVAANVGSARDAREAREMGAEAIGLLRTEFLFLTRSTPPDEAEQLRALQEIGDNLGDLPVIVRTLDVGGDKDLPYIQLPQEANPFLGVRAIRLSYQKPDLFKTQLRAILRAGEKRRFKIMFPMVASRPEIEWAKGMLTQAHQELEAEGLGHLWPVDTGIMVEVPAAAVLSPLLAAEVDFFSIGTNDLTQYTLAAERGNPALPELADALHPAVLELIRQVVQAAHAAGKWVGVCGELAGDPLAVPVLVGLGVDELSLNPAGIPQVKHILRQLELSEAQKLAAEVLTTADAAAARALAAAFYQQIPKA